MRRCRLISWLFVVMAASIGMLATEWAPSINTSTMRAWGWDLQRGTAAVGVHGGLQQQQVCEEESMTPRINASSDRDTPPSPPPPPPPTADTSASIVWLTAQVRDFSWRGGGVRGLSAEEVDSTLDDLYKRIKVKHGDALHQFGPCAFPRTGRGSSLMERYIVETALELRRLDEEPSGDDCRYRLPPHQRAVCLAMAVVGAGVGPLSFSAFAASATGGNNLSSPLQSDHHDTLPSADGSSVALHDLPHYRATHCRALSPCADWSRGRFTLGGTVLTSPLLKRVLDHIVIPRLRGEGGVARGNVSFYAKQLLHGEGNTEEWPWLLRRSKVMELDLEKRRSLYYLTAPPPPPNPRRRFVVGNNIPINLPMMWHNSTWAQSSTDLSGALQGANPPATAPYRLPLLAPLEMLAALWGLVGPSVDGNILNVMIFNGDSVNREVFHRLIHWLRYGGGPHKAHDKQGHYTPMPHLHYASHYDMVYAVHSGYDELLGFHSPQTNGSSTYTVERYFRAVRRNVTAHMARRRHEEAEGGSNQEGVSPAALLYIVWLWDPFTRWSRGVMSSYAPAPSVPAKQATVAGSHCIAVSNASTQPPLVAYNVRPSILVQGTGFWERQQGKHVMDILTSSVVGDPTLSSDGDMHLSGDDVTNKGTPPLLPRRVYLMTAPSEELLEDLVDAAPPHPPRAWGARPHVVGSASKRRVGEADALPEATALLLDPPGSVNAHTHYNLIKNQLYFEWLTNVTQWRSRRHVEQHRHLQQLPPPATTTSTTVQLLDKAKAQFLEQRVLRDKIHFTCRATFAFAKVRFFEGSMAEWTLGRLLLPVSVAVAPRRYTDAAATSSPTQQPHTTYDNDVSLLAPHTQVDNISGTAALNALPFESSWCAAVGPGAMSAVRVGRYWFKILKPARVRHELWSALGLETHRIRGPIVTGVLLPRGILHPELVKELGFGQGRRVEQVQGLGDAENALPPQVYINVDSPRVDCTDDGDNVLLHTLVQSAYLK